MAKRKRRTKKQYLHLFDNPRALFPPSASSEGVEVILFPNGETGTIWFRDSAGNGFRVSAGRGPAGIGLTVSRFTLGGSLTITGNKGEGYESYTVDDVREIEICQYDRDNYAQAYKAWYCSDVKGKDRPAHPGSRAEFYAAPLSGGTGK